MRQKRLKRFVNKKFKSPRKLEEYNEINLDEF